MKDLLQQAIVRDTGLLDNYAWK